MKTLLEIRSELPPQGSTSRQSIYRDIRTLRIRPVGFRRIARGRPLALYPDDTAKRILAHRNPTGTAKPGPAPRIATLAQLRRIARNN